MAKNTHAHGRTAVVAFFRYFCIIFMGHHNDDDDDANASSLSLEQYFAVVIVLWLLHEHYFYDGFHFLAAPHITLVVHDKSTIKKIHLFRNQCDTLIEATKKNTFHVNVSCFYFSLNIWNIYAQFVMVTFITKIRRNE